MSMKVIGHRTTKPVLHIWDNCPIFQRGNISYFVDCNVYIIDYFGCYLGYPLLCNGHQGAEPKQQNRCDLACLIQFGPLVNQKQESNSVLKYHCIINLLHCMALNGY